MRVEQNEHEVNSTDILNNINIALIQNNLRSVSCQNKIIKNRNLQKNVVGSAILLINILIGKMNQSITL